MSQPSSPTVATSPSSSSTPEPTSYKKPLRIRNERSEKRRNALKEYYKLKEQQKQLDEKNATLVPTPTRGDGDNDDLETEISENRHIDDIDLEHADFKDVLAQTNRLSTSINLINSSIKNIIYNNYYELIKLNDFLNDLNDLNISSLIDQQKKQTHEKKDVLDFLNTNSKPESQESTGSVTPLDVSGLDKLRDMMKKIEAHDKKKSKQTTTEYLKQSSSSASSSSAGISTLLQLQDSDSTTLEEDYRVALNGNIENWIENLKKEDGQQGLVRQLEDIKRSVQPSSSI